MKARRCCFSLGKCCFASCIRVGFPQGISIRWPLLIFICFKFLMFEVSICLFWSILKRQLAKYLAVQHPFHLFSIQFSGSSLTSNCDQIHLYKWQLRFFFLRPPVLNRSAAFVATSVSIASFSNLSRYPTLTHILSLFCLYWIFETCILGKW